MEALGALYDRHVDDLFAVSIYVCPDRGAAQDAIHDMFLDLYRYHKKLAPADNVRAYLITALRRKLYKVRKRTSRSLDDEANTSRILDQPGLATESAEDVIVLEETRSGLRQSLHQALQTLTEHQKQAIQLRFKEEKTYEEIADDLRLSVPSARTLVYRTLKAMRKAALSLLF